MARQTEGNANAALADLLRGMMHGCEVRSESTRTISEGSGSRPDILITAADRAPVVIEAEYMPALEVEDDAVKRLGLEAANTGRKIEAVIALRYPEGLEFEYSLAAAVAGARLSYCALTAAEDGAGFERFPASGWLEGSAADVADLARLVSVPQSAVNAAAAALERGIDSATAFLQGLETRAAAVNHDVAALLGMSNVPQTQRMACAIIANAMVFHDRVAGMHEGVKPLRLVCGPRVENPQAEIIEAWTHILAINYWPIFAIARDIVEQLPAADAVQILRRLQDTAGDVAATGANVAHDLTGRIFQRLIVDRKYLATFYTLPASAALLARLAVEKLQGVDWSDAEAVGRLRVGDFACGTGALLGAVYEQFASRHERTGGDPSALHRAMMEDALYGCDVMPSAIHITGSTLSGMQPNVGYGNSRLYTMPYGRQADGSVAIGSLELLQASSVMTLFNTSDPAMRTGSAGEETAAQVLADIPDEGFDLVIMNPPFTRATNHGGVHANVVNPAFAAFEASKADMDAMSKRMKDLSKRGRNEVSCYHGNAGIASAFAELAHYKLKPGGVFAFVLPLVAANGLSWQKFRQMLARHYTDLQVLSIAAADIRDISFSADTGLGECLIIARKRGADEQPTGGDIRFISLTQRPSGFVQANEFSKKIISAVDVRGLEDGPYGGTPITVGTEHTGEMVSERAKITALGSNFRALNAVRVKDYSVAQTAQALSNSRLWLPGTREAVELKTATLSAVGRLGFLSRDITDPRPRGPFDKVRASPTATYPALWNHNAKNETRVVCEPDSQLQVRIGMEAKAIKIWKTASRVHHNVEFRYNSQPLSVAITELPSIGGRAWPNVIFDDNRFDYAFAVWGNSTLGILMHWWHSSRQDTGRGAISIRSAETLPVLDLRALSDEQLLMAELIFEEFRTLELKPAYLADADEKRALLDRRVVCDLLGFGEDVYRGARLLAAKWCAEPSVHGGKGRGRGAGV